MCVCRCRRDDVTGDAMLLTIRVLRRNFKMNLFLFLSAT